METSLLEQGLELMVAGMGTVFVFLTTLVFATMAMSRLIARFYPAPQVDPSVGADASPEEIAAISAAVTRHREQTG